MRNKIVSTAMLAASLALVGCSDDGSPSYQVNTLGLTSNFADNVLIPQYQDFQQQTVALSTAIDSYCDAIGGADEVTTRQAALTQWLATTASWQQAEAYLVGPAAENENNIRNRINFFSDGSYINACRIDQTTLDVAATPDEVQAGALSNNQRGLGGLEYLLFSQSETYACDDEAPVAWTSMSATERAQARCEQAQKIVGYVNTQAETLVNDWDIENGNYRSAFINPSVSGTQVNALSDSLFYLDTQVKDSKLRVPLGISSDTGTNCAFNACSGLVEYGYSESSIAAIRNNLIGFKAVFTGNGGYSFDDIMIDQGHADVAELFVTLVDDAIATTNASQDSLKAQAETLLTMNNGACANIAANPDADNELRACLLYGKVKRITDELKTSYVAIVNLDIPDRAQSDND